MARYRVESIELYSRVNVYDSIEAASPQEAVEIAKGEAEDSSKHCDYAGWDSTLRVEDNDTGEVWVDDELKKEEPQCEP